VTVNGTAQTLDLEPVFTLSAALLSEITIANGRIVQKNLRDYPMIDIADAPKVVTPFVRSDAPLGEPCVPPGGGCFWVAAIAGRQS
jgi:CO/xanthine dehydrogenase Mo-binding subunit